MPTESVLSPLDAYPSTALSAVTSTPEQEKLLIVLRHGMPDVNERNDPPNMNDLMHRLERLDLKDEEGGRCAPKYSRSPSGLIDSTPNARLRLS
jgi:hypothetical protein